MRNHCVRVLWFSIFLLVFDQLLAQDFKFEGSELTKSLERVKVALLEEDELPVDLLEELLTHVDNSDQKDQILFELGRFLTDNYKYYAAQQYLGQVLDKSEDPKLLADAHFQLGLGYMFRYAHARSIGEFQSALGQYESINDSLGMGIALDRIADSYNYIGDHEIARPFYDRGLAIFKAIKNYSRLSNIIGNIGGMMEEEGILDSAHWYYTEAIEFDRIAKDSSTLRSHISGLAMVLEKQGDNEASLQRHYEAFDLGQQTKNPIDVAFTHQHLGYFYHRVHNYDSALHYMRITNQLGEEMNHAQLIENSLEVLKDIYEKRKMYKEALEVYRREVALNDSIGALQNAELVEELRAQYEVEKAETENEALREQAELRETVILNQKRTTAILSIGTILLVAAIIILFLLNTSRRRKNLIIRKDRDLIRQQADKLAEIDAYKSRFFANISHDFRTPLTLIQGYLDMITREENHLTTRSEQALSHLNENVDRLRSMTDEIRDLIKLEEKKVNLKFIKINVNTFFQMLAEMFRSTASSKGINVVFESNVSERQDIHTDKYAIEKVIFNLVDNSLKYNTSGKLLKIALVHLDDHVRVDVCDDGPGIDKAKIPYVFERYFQTNETGHKLIEGQGIGLSVVKEYVELLGGQITVRSTPFTETVFSLTLPYYHEPNAEEVAEVDQVPDERLEQRLELHHKKEKKPLQDDNLATAARGGTDKKQILVVDDHPDIRTFVKDLLQHEYSVLEAADGNDAWFVLESTEGISLVVTDLMMPWLDGFDLIDKIKDNPKLHHIPILVVSARAGDEDKLNALGKGVSGFLSKPFNGDELKVRVANLIGESAEQKIETWVSLVSESNKEEVGRGILGQIDELIVENIGNGDLSVLDIANAISASERKTYRLIQRLTGKTPLEYIKLIRYQYVEELIRNDKVDSLTEAARAIGMNNVTQFGKQFERYRGVSAASLLK
ncbi:MAG: response regulator [Cyclobacteriaceae bacterium]